MLLDDHQAAPDSPIAIRLLGDVDVTRGGRRVPDLTPARAEVLALIALCGRDGISASELVDLVASKYEKIKTSALHRRISDLHNKCGIQFQRFQSSGNRYILQLELVESIDSEDFIQGVTGLSPQATIAELDALMALWRDDPWAGSDPSRPWARVVQARDILVDRLACHPELSDSAQLARFAELFPTLPNLADLRARFRLQTRVKPSLLVVEDQIIDDICDILDSEFGIVRVTSLKEWNCVRDTLNVDGALIDLHLTADLADNYGTTVIAEHLRKHTEIPVALMSVATPARYQAQGDMRLKYRLVEIVRKDFNGRLNGVDLLDSARQLVDTNPHAKLYRLQLWVDSDEYHVRNDLLLAGHRRAEQQAAEVCEREAEALRAELRIAQTPSPTLEADVKAFHLKWGPARQEARS